MRSLVIGGTGMLAAATHWLADRSELTLVVARHATRFAGEGSRFLPLDLDWNAPGFARGVCAAVATNWPIQMALLWLHNPDAVLGELVPHLKSARIVLVLGGLDGSPALPDAKDALVTVRLGSKALRGGGRRWLTDKEISDGAIGALSDGRSRIVGELTGLS
jgi:hypothetical protein